MNTRFRRLRKNTSRPDAPAKAMPFMPMIDDWLKRNRQEKERRWERERPEIRVPVDMPFDRLPEDRRESGDSTIKPVIIDINGPDNTLN